MERDLRFGKAPQRPATTDHRLSQETSSPSALRVDPMPIISVSFYYQSGTLKDEIGLETTEHRLVHLELETAPCEFPIQCLLDGGHSGWECSPQSSLSHLLTGFRRGIQFGLPHPFTIGRVQPSATGCLAHFFDSCSRMAVVVSSKLGSFFGMFGVVFTQRFAGLPSRLQRDGSKATCLPRLTQFLSHLWRVHTTFWWHRPNYNALHNKVV